MNCTIARCSRAIGPVSTTKRAGNLAGSSEVHELELLAEIDMIARLEFETARLAPATHFDVRRLVAPFRDARMQHVRNDESQVVPLLLRLHELRFRFGELGAERLVLLQERRDVLSLRLRFADALGVKIALVAQLVGTDLPFLARLFEPGETSDIERETAAREVGRDAGRVGTKQLGIEHGKKQLAVGSWQLAVSVRDRHRALEAIPLTIRYPLSASFSFPMPP
jgi:hypothetical protein